MKITKHHLITALVDSGVHVDRAEQLVTTIFFPLMTLDGGRTMDVDKAISMFEEIAPKLNRAAEHLHTRYT